MVETHKEALERCAEFGVVPCHDVDERMLEAHTESEETHFLVGALNHTACHCFLSPFLGCFRLNLGKVESHAELERVGETPPLFHCLRLVVLPVSQRQAAVEELVNL